MPCRGDTKKIDCSEKVVTLKKIATDPICGEVKTPNAIREIVVSDFFAFLVFVLFGVGAAWLKHNIL